MLLAVCPKRCGLIEMALYKSLVYACIYVHVCMYVLHVCMYVLFVSMYLLPLTFKVITKRIPFTHSLKLISGDRKWPVYTTWITVE